MQNLLKMKRSSALRIQPILLLRLLYVAQWESDRLFTDSAADQNRPWALIFITLLKYLLLFFVYL